MLDGEKRTNKKLDDMMETIKALLNNDRKKWIKFRIKLCFNFLLSVYIVQSILILRSLLHFSTSMIITINKIIIIEIMMMDDDVLGLNDYH